MNLNTPPREPWNDAAADLLKWVWLAHESAREIRSDLENHLHVPAGLSTARQLERELAVCNKNLAANIPTDVPNLAAALVCVTAVTDIVHRTYATCSVLASDLAVVLETTLARRRAAKILDALYSVLTAAGRLGIELDRQQLKQLASAPPTARKGIQPIQTATHIVQAASRVLPMKDRLRYRDEFQSELYELATARTSRWGQLMYAIRLLDRAWVLRAELRESVARRVPS